MALEAVTVELRKEGMCIVTSSVSSFEEKPPLLSLPDDSVPFIWNEMGSSVYL